MNIDGLTLSVLVRELTDTIQASQIQKLYQIDKTTLNLKLHGHRGSHDLIVTVGANPSVYVAPPLQDVPKEPTSLCMLLRKHIEGARITVIQQLHGDRIICFQLDKLELDGSLHTTYMYIELMGKYSNCIFVQNDVILESLVHVTPLMNRTRSIGPKQPYELPPNTNRMDFFAFTASELRSLLESFHQDTVGQTIRNIFNGFGKPLLDAVCSEAQVEASTAWNIISDDTLDALIHALFHLQASLREAKGLYWLRQENGKIIPSAIPLPHTTVEQYYPTISEAISQSVQQSGAIHTAGRDLERLLQQAIKKERLRHEKIKGELKDTEKMDTYKLYGDLLMIHSYLTTHYEKEVTVSNLLADPPEDITIPLQPQLTIVENAQWFYKMYTKLKNRLISGQYQLDQSTMKIHYLESMLFSISLCQDRQSLEEIRREAMEAGLIKKSKKPSPYKVGKDRFIHYTIPGGDIYIGKNNEQNEYLTNRFAKPTDIWFHTQDVHGSHVILRPTYEPDDMLLSIVCQYAAWFSQGQQSSKVAVDYTKVKNIKKPPQAPLGYVIFSTHNTMIVEPKNPADNPDNHLV